MPIPGSADIVGVPYKSGGESVTAVLGGQVQMTFEGITILLPLIREGKLHGLAVTSLDRFAATPDLPAVAESGFPGFDVTASFGLMVAAGTPAAVIDKIHRDTVRVLAQGELRQRFADIGVVAIGNSPAAFSAALKAEAVQWAKLIKEAGIRASE